MNNRDNTDIPRDQGIPQGLSMALAQNIYAAEHFASLPEGERRAIIARSRTIGSREEMTDLVNSLIRH